jgi:methylated-DNA-[protein]-cysteine S-methyltransferase
MRPRVRYPAEVFCSFYSTDLGSGGVVASSAGLLEVFLPFGGEDREGIMVRIALHYSAPVAENSLTRIAAALLARYFAGEQVVFDLPVDRRCYTPFQWAVYEAVMAIPYGELRSYSQVAAEIGRPKAARGIGGAMAGNSLPIIIPCHRVVGKSGSMTGYSAAGGIGSKIWLLNMEQLAVKEKLNKNGSVSQEL